VASAHQQIEPTARDGEGPRRSALLQDRSRRTRRRLVRAALALWSERGFDRGVSETTVEEIARAAGVTKGTFYFHFAHKEDILLELGWGTAEVLYEEASDGAAAGLPAADVLDGLLVTLARRVESVPKVATARSVAEFYRSKSSDDSVHFGIRRSFSVALELGRQQGTIGIGTGVDEVAVILEVLVIDAIVAWTRIGAPLLDLLRQRAAIILAGATAVNPTTQSRRDDTRPPLVAVPGEALDATTPGATTPGATTPGATAADGAR
jgi:AcrR family transcriptional regulator